MPRTTSRRFGCGSRATSRPWTRGLTPKHLTDIQHELESLARRQAELEDVELEILERMEEGDQRRMPRVCWQRVARGL